MKSSFGKPEPLIKADTFCGDWAAESISFLAPEEGTPSHLAPAHFSRRSGHGGSLSVLTLPGIIGLLSIGILLCPYALNWLDKNILSISADLRQMDLTIILLKAGLSPNPDNRKEVRCPACRLASKSRPFSAYPLSIPYQQNRSRRYRCYTGNNIPDGCDPPMAQPMREKYGVSRSIPQLMVAGASCDGLFVAVLFFAFIHMVQGGSASLWDFMALF